MLIIEYICIYFIRSFGCTLYELFKLERIFYQKNQYKLTEYIKSFDVNTNLNKDNIKPEKFVRVLQKYVFFLTL